MKAPFLAILLLASLVVADLASANIGPDAITWGSAGTLVEAAPGDTARPFTVTFRNLNQTTFTNVRATFQRASWMLSPTPGGSTASLSGDFKPGDVWAAKFYADVDNTAIAGAYAELTFFLEMYDKANATAYAETVTGRVQVTGRASLQVSSTPANIPIGQDTPVVLSVTNVGSGPAGNVQAAISASQGLSIVGGDASKSLGALPAGAVQNMTVIVRASIAGTVTLSAAMSYLDSAGTASSASRTVYIEAGNNDTHNLDDPGAHLAQAQLDAGRATDLTFTVWNNGTNPMINATGIVSVGSTLSVPDATDQQALGTLAAGASTTMVVHVLSDNTARGVQKLPLTVTWTRPDGSLASHTFNLAAALVGKVDVQLPNVVATVNNNTLAATITGTLTNVGNTAALSANIQLLPSANFQATDPQYIGDLSTNTGVPFTITSTLLNTSLLNASASTGAGGQRIFRGDNGTPPPDGFGGGNASFPGNFTRGNRTGGFGGGGFGRFGGGNNVTLRLTWNDEYGVAHSAFYSVPITVRSATSSTRPTAASATTKVPMPEPALVLALVAMAAVGVASWQRKRRG